MSIPQYNQKRRKVVTEFPKEFTGLANALAKLTLEELAELEAQIAKYGSRCVKLDKERDERINGKYASADIVGCVRQVVDYNWTDERADFKEYHKMGEDNTDHIFNHLVDLQNWLDGGTAIAEQEAGIPAEVPANA